MKVKVLVSQLRLTLGNPMDWSLLDSSVHGIFQTRILKWVCHFLLRGIFPTQGLNLGLLYCRLPGGKSLTFLTWVGKWIHPISTVWCLDAEVITLLTCNGSLVYFLKTNRQGMDCFLRAPNIQRYPLSPPLHHYDVRMSWKNQCIIWGSIFPFPKIPIHP